MPSICLSTALATNTACNLFSIGTNVGIVSAGSCASQIPFLNYNSSYNSGGGGIRIMKGAVPVSFSEISTYSSRSTDVLIAWTPTNSYFPSVSTYTTNPLTLNVYPITASASGTATWFWGFQNCPLTNGDTTPQPNRFWGTVGLQGSGADLEISDVNIVSGNVYKIINLRIGIPQSYTY